MSDIVISGYHGFANSGDEALLFAILKTLRKKNPHDFLIESVELLGSDEKIKYIRNEEGLEITLKEKPDTDLPLCFKMAIG